MQRTLLPLLAVLVLVAGGAIWILRGRAATRSPPGVQSEGTGPGPLPGPAALAPAIEKAGVEPRSEALPRAAAATPAAPAVRPQPDPALPPPGAGVAAIFGGADAYREFYRDIPGEGRKSRLAQLEEVLAEYTDGDPKDRREFDKYEALKDEAEWLRVHFDN